MSNKEKYDDVFMKSFQIGKDMLNESLVYQSVPNWDSVGHMALIAALEESFDIMLDTEDVIDISSYQKGIEIIRKYKVEL